MAQSDLRRVERARDRLEEARDEMFAAIVMARDSGESLRDIARAAGLSHQRVHQIAQERRREQ